MLRRHWPNFPAVGVADAAKVAMVDVVPAVGVTAVVAVAVTAVDAAAPADLVARPVKADSAEGCRAAVARHPIRK